MLKTSCLLSVSEPIIYFYFSTAQINLSNRFTPKRSSPYSLFNLTSLGILWSGIIPSTNFEFDAVILSTLNHDRSINNEKRVTKVESGNFFTEIALSRTNSFQIQLTLYFNLKRVCLPSK